VEASIAELGPEQGLRGSLGRSTHSRSLRHHAHVTADLEPGSHAAQTRGSSFGIIPLSPRGRGGE
jgi:hypothetical protein